MLVNGHVVRCLRVVSFDLTSWHKIDSYTVVNQKPLLREQSTIHVVVAVNTIA